MAEPWDDLPSCTGERAQKPRLVSVTAKVTQDEKRGIWKLANDAGTSPARVLRDLIRQKLQMPPLNQG